MKFLSHDLFSSHQNTRFLNVNSGGNGDSTRTVEGAEYGDFGRENGESLRGDIQEYMARSSEAACNDIEQLQSGSSVMLNTLEANYLQNSHDFLDAGSPFYGEFRRGDRRMLGILNTRLSVKDQILGVVGRGGINLAQTLEGSGKNGAEYYETLLQHYLGSTLSAIQENQLRCETASLTVLKILNESLSSIEGELSARIENRKARRPHLEESSQYWRRFYRDVFGGKGERMFTGARERDIDREFFGGLSDIRGTIKGLIHDKENEMKEIQSSFKRWWAGRHANPEDLTERNQVNDVIETITEDSNGFAQGNILTTGGGTNIDDTLLEQYFGTNNRRRILDFLEQGNYIESHNQASEVIINQEDRRRDFTMNIIKRRQQFEGFLEQQQTAGETGIFVRVKNILEEQVRTLKTSAKLSNKRFCKKIIEGYQGDKAVLFPSGHIEDTVDQDPGELIAHIFRFLETEGTEDEDLETALDVFDDDAKKHILSFLSRSAKRQSDLEPQSDVDSGGINARRKYHRHLDEGINKAQGVHALFNTNKVSDVILKFADPRSNARQTFTQMMSAADSLQHFIDTYYSNTENEESYCHPKGPKNNTNIIPNADERTLLEQGWQQIILLNEEIGRHLKEWKDAVKKDGPVEQYMRENTETTGLSYTPKKGAQAGVEQTGLTEEEFINVQIHDLEGEREELIDRKEMKDLLKQRIQALEGEKRKSITHFKWFKANIEGEITEAETILARLKDTSAQEAQRQGIEEKYTTLITAKEVEIQDAKNTQSDRKTEYEAKRQEKQSLPSTVEAHTPYQEAASDLEDLKELFQEYVEAGDDEKDTKAQQLESEFGHYPTSDQINDYLPYQIAEGQLNDVKAKYHELKALPDNCEDYPPYQQITQQLEQKEQELQQLHDQKAAELDAVNNNPDFDDLIDQEITKVEQRINDIKQLVNDEFDSTIELLERERNAAEQRKNDAENDYNAQKTADHTSVPDSVEDFPPYAAAKRSLATAKASLSKKKQEKTEAVVNRTEKLETLRTRLEGLKGGGSRESFEEAIKEKLSVFRGIAQSWTGDGDPIRKIETEYRSREESLTQQLGNASTHTEGFTIDGYVKEYLDGIDDQIKKLKERRDKIHAGRRAVLPLITDPELGHITNDINNADHPYENLAQLKKKSEEWLQENAYKDGPETPDATYNRRVARYVKSNSNIVKQMEKEWLKLHKPHFQTEVEPILHALEVGQRLPSNIRYDNATQTRKTSVTNRNSIEANPILFDLEVFAKDQETIKLKGKRRRNPGGAEEKVMVTMCKSNIKGHPLSGVTGQMWIETEVPGAQGKTTVRKKQGSEKAMFVNWTRSKQEAEVQGKGARAELASIRDGEGNQKIYTITDPETGELLELHGAEFQERDVPTGSTLEVGRFNGRYILMDTETGEQIRCKKGNTLPPTSLELTAGTSVIIKATKTSEGIIGLTQDNKFLKLLDADMRSGRYEISKPSDSYNDVVISRLEGTARTQNFSGSITTNEGVHEIDSLQPAKKYEEVLSDSNTTTVFSPDDETFHRIHGTGLGSFDAVSLTEANQLMIITNLGGNIIINNTDIESIDIVDLENDSSMDEKDTYTIESGGKTYLVDRNSPSIYRADNRFELNNGDEPKIQRTNENRTQTDFMLYENSGGKFYPVTTESGVIIPDLREKTARVVSARESQSEYFLAVSNQNYWLMGKSHALKSKNTIKRRMRRSIFQSMDGTHQFKGKFNASGTMTYQVDESDFDQMEVIKSETIVSLDSTNMCLSFPGQTTTVPPVNIEMKFGENENFNRDDANMILGFQNGVAYLEDSHQERQSIALTA